MARVIKPELSECSYRKKLLENKKTMEFNHGTIPFEKENWKDWYQNWVLADPKDKFYRYIYCGACEDFVASCGYYHEDERYYLFLLTEYSKRETGYGNFALQSVCKEAVENQIDKIYVRVAKDNPSLSFFEHRCFCIEEENDKEVVLSCKTANIAEGRPCACECKGD